ncbi:MAG: hypothetical protein KKB59_18770 [Spirochaetes bacterium]|nr:hypothetical protein [Spirochaetota bacterium]
MAKIYTDIEAKEFFSGKKVKLEICTDNVGAVLSVNPSDEDRKKLLACEDTVTLPRRIWENIPYAFKYWDAKHNMEPLKETEPTQQ